MKTKQKVLGILAIVTILGTSTTATTSVFAASATTVVPSNHQTVPGHHHMHCHQLQDVSSIIGVDVKTLHQELKSGKTIAEIAQTKGVSEQKLIAELKSRLQTRLDNAVQDGELTQDKKQKILSKADTKLKKFVERKHMKHQHMKHQHTEHE